MASRTLQIKGIRESEALGSAKNRYWLNMTPAGCIEGFQLNCTEPFEINQQI